MFCCDAILKQRSLLSIWHLVLPPSFFLTSVVAFLENTNSLKIRSSDCFFSFLFLKLSAGLDADTVNVCCFYVLIYFWQNVIQLKSCVFEDINMEISVESAHPKRNVSELHQLQRHAA